MSTMATDPPVAGQQSRAAGRFGSLRQRLRQGDLGALPVVIGLVVICVVFQLANSNFLTARNLTNLVLQIAAVGTISVGVVLVLLLGEIDLSVGAVSGFGAAVMAILNVKHGWAGPPAILAGMLTGTAVGLLQGFWITRFRVPSFVVTLAGLLAWQGALLQVLGGTGTVNLTEPTITRLAGTFFPTAVGWLFGAIAVGVYLGNAYIVRRRRVAAGLTVDSPGTVAAKVAVVFVAVLGATAVLNGDRGVPLAVVIFLGFILLFHLLLTQTRFGRYVYAVGGNAEAARRAGIHIDRVRLAVYTLASTLAACGGILAASRLLAVNQASGSGDVLLNAIAAAVIGGTGLFGGRGTVWSALLGALVIGSISNGMDLLALSSAVKFMITGGVLLLAVTIDALSRRGRAAAGKA